MYTVNVCAHYCEVVRRLPWISKSSSYSLFFFFFLSKTLVSYVLTGCLNRMKMTEKDRKWKITHWHSSINVFGDFIETVCVQMKIVFFSGAFFLHFWKMCRVSGLFFSWTPTIDDYFASVFVSHSTFSSSIIDHDIQIMCAASKTLNLHIFEAS